MSTTSTPERERLQREIAVEAPPKPPQPEAVAAARPEARVTVTGPDASPPIPSQRMEANPAEFQATEVLLPRPELADSQAIGDSSSWLRRRFRRRKSNSTTTPSITPTTTSVAGQPVFKTQQRHEIESVLTSGMSDIYQKMTPQQQTKFRVAGEVAAAAIDELITSFRATAHRIVDIIRAWLSLVPGVNPYYLQQESKIKTDRILELQHRYKKSARLKNLQIK